MSNNNDNNKKNYTIDTSKPVLVTGATGYLAGVLIQELLEEGLTVHATVRDATKKDRFQYLQDLADRSKGSIRFFSADLCRDGSFAEAMKGCAIVFHTASPFLVAWKDPQTDLMEPAVQGTENVLKTANQTPTVQRVVLTSSSTAVAADMTEQYSAPGHVFTENVWNRTATMDYMPYMLSKTMAEQRAWVIAGSQTQWKLVVINPPLIFGPGVKYHETSVSHMIMKRFGDGTFGWGVANFGFGMSDVRDVAHAHVAAAFVKGAWGRNIVCGHNADFLQVAQALQPKYAPKYPIPTRKVPKLLLYLLGPWLPEGGLLRRYVKNNVDIIPNFDSSKAKEELGITFRPLEETVQDMFQQLIEEGVFAK